MLARLSFALVALLIVCSVLVSGDDRPIQQRIALLPDGMTVSWSTVGPMEAAPSARYGLKRTDLSTNVTGITRHYESSTTWFHHVELHGLQPNTTYYWQPITESRTPVLKFITAPPVPASGEGEFSVAIYGDLGITNSETDTATPAPTRPHWRHQPVLARGRPRLR